MIDPAPNIYIGSACSSTARTHHRTSAFLLVRVSRVAPETKSCRRVDRVQEEEEGEDRMEMEWTDACVAVGGRHRQAFMQAIYLIISIWPNVRCIGLACRAPRIWRYGLPRLARPDRARRSVLPFFF